MWGHSQRTSPQLLSRNLTLLLVLQHQQGAEKPCDTEYNHSSMPKGQVQLCTNLTLGIMQVSPWLQQKPTSPAAVQSHLQDRSCMASNET